MTRSAVLRTLAITTAMIVALAVVPQTAVAEEGAPAPSPTVSPAVTPTPAPTPTPTAPARSVYGYFTLPWVTGTVYQSWTDGTVRSLSRAQWQKTGASSRVAPIRYVKVAWSPSRYALVTFPHRVDDRAVDRVVTLTSSQYRSAGTPRVTTVAEVPTSTYFRYASSGTDRYVRTPDGRGHKLTAREYAAAGKPSAKTVYGGYYRLKWSKSVSFVAADGSRRALSSAQYKNAGSPRVAVAPTVYVKTAWSGPYALVTWPHKKNDSAVDQVVRLSAAQYKAAGSPRLTVRPRIPGDSFVRLDVGRQIFHRFRGHLTPVTATQWRAAGSPPVTTVAPAKPTYIRGILIVNKSLPLPSTFGNGLRPELTSAFAKMKAAARKAGVPLRIISGFRSYASQKSVYAAKVRQYGFATAQLRSARPGHSEHQTGLAIDVNSISQSWGDTAAGKWVARNAHTYGFIVRYPRGKTGVTGYAYEPWHLRYVGVEVASHLHAKKLTLEEYLGVPSVY